MRDDIVSRQEVMASLVAEYNRRYNEGGLKLAWIEKAVNEAPSAWIDAEIEIPVNDDHVLCVTRTAKGRQNVVIGYYMDGLWRCGMNSNVTHWMPLPAAPDEKEDAKRA